MGRDEQFEGIYARKASILVSFNWEGRRHRERIAISPTPANLRAAAKLRDRIVKSIDIEKYTIEDFAADFPDSPYLKKVDSPVGVTFGDAAATWLTIVAGELAATTIKEYRNTLQRHFYPEFEQRQIASITYEELALLLARKKVKNAKTFNNLMTPARGVFGLALRMKKIAIDITAEIPTRKYQKPEPDPLDIDEIELVLAHIKSHYDEQWFNYFEFAFFAGPRPSEEIAVSWQNIDFRRKKCLIDAARVRAIDKDAKTHRSRYLDLNSRALAALQRQKKHTFLKKSGYVFSNPYTGERLLDTGPAVQLVWRPALKALGIRDRDAKQTRHSFATMCLHAGMNPAYVARQMGHTDTRMFFEVYSKWIDGEANDREISKLDAMLASPKGVAVL
jgi:integrase